MTERLLELARAFAAQRHVDAQINGKAYDGHQAVMFDVCLHPDCVLVRGGSAPAPATKLCADDAHVFGPCKTCGMPYLASRLVPPTEDDIAWATSVLAERDHEQAQTVQSEAATGTAARPVEGGATSQSDDSQSGVAVATPEAAPAVPPPRTDAAVLYMIRHNLGLDHGKVWDEALEVWKLIQAHRAAEAQRSALISQMRALKSWCDEKATAMRDKGLDKGGTKHAWECAGAAEAFEICEQKLDALLLGAGET